MPLNRNLVPGSINRSVRSKLWGRGREIWLLCAAWWRLAERIQPCSLHFKRQEWGKSWEIMIWGITNDKPYRGRKLNFTCSRRELSWYQENPHQNLQFSPISPPGTLWMCPPAPPAFTLHSCCLFPSGLAANSSGGWHWELLLVMARGKVWFLRNPPVLLEQAMCVRSSANKRWTRSGREWKMRKEKKLK